jgi:hypothetical protein
MAVGPAGLGGESSTIDPSGKLNTSWVSYQPDLGLHLGFGYVDLGQNTRQDAYSLMASRDGLHGWRVVNPRLLSSEGTLFDRIQSSTEFVGY